MNKAFKKYGKAKFKNAAPWQRRFKWADCGYKVWVGSAWGKAANTTFNMGVENE